MRRGFVFTLDALLSLLLVMMFVTGIVVMTENTSQVYSTYMRSQSQHVASDTLETLRTVPLNQLVPQDKINEWIKEGVLDTELVNPAMNPLDIVSTYWATEPLYPSKNLHHKAEIILGYLLNTTLRGYDYELLINNYTSPYLRKMGSNYSKAPDVSPATLIMSGYAYNQTPRGYMARAYLTKIGSKENTYYLRGGYIYARTDDSSDAVVIRYIVPADAIPSDAVVDEIDWFLEPAWVSSNYDIYLNGHHIWSGTVGNNKLISDSNPSGGYELLENFHPGQDNVFEVRVYKPGYDGGEDGAQYIRIRYHTSTPSTFAFRREFHFEDTTAHYGVEIWKYLFVPGKLNSLNIQIAVGNVTQNTPVSISFMFDQQVNIPPTRCLYDSSTRIKTCYWDNSTIASTLSNAGYNYKHISSRYTTIILDAGGRNTYYPSRIHVIGSKSFVKADYSTDFVLTPYTIDITEPISLPDQGFTRDITVNFNVPPGVIPVWVKFQFPWLYYTNYNPSQEITVDNDVISPTYLYKHPPNPFIYALARVGYTADTFDYQYNPLHNAIANGRNTLHIVLGQGYYLQPSNGNGELTYLVQAYAGYGDVFPKFIRPGCNGYNITYYYVNDNNPHHILAGDTPYCDVTADQLLANRTTYAVDDAIIRLFNNLGGNGTRDSPLLIELPSTVTIDFASMGNIPGLFKPIRITLRVWREKP